MPCPTGKSAMSFDLAAKARSRSSKSHDKAMGMYRCALCGDWHLGNPSRQWHRACGNTTRAERKQRSKTK